jgi:hypothetical protein
MAVSNKNKLKASSIIEVVIAMTIIAVMVAIGSMIFVNINQSNSTLKEINEEGEVLTEFINQRLILGKEVEAEDFNSSKLIISKTENEESQSLIYQLRGRNNNTFDFGTLGTVMEGKFRPGHFSGVALIVSKLFNIVLPDFAFFGQKDLQQLTIIKKLVEELFFNLEVITVPIKREPHGLAMSSRNERLTNEERNEAEIFFNALSEAKSILKEDQSAEKAERKVKALFDKHKAQLEYFEIVSDTDLLPKTENYLEADTVLCIAGFMGNVRLIDNMYLIS